MTSPKDNVLVTKIVQEIRSGNAGCKTSYGWNDQSPKQGNKACRKAMEQSKFRLEKLKNNKFTEKRNTAGVTRW